MKKIKLFLAGLLICSGVYASEKEEVSFLDKLYTQKKYSMALEQSEAFIKKYPKSKYIKNIKIRVGHVYYIEGKYEKSIDTLNSCLKELKLKKTEGNDIYLYLAKNYIALRDFNTATRALEYIDKSATNGKNCYEEGVLSLGKGYIEQGNYQKAQEILLNALNIKGAAYNDIALNLALASYNNAEYQKTINYLDNYYNANTDDIVNYLYASSYYKINDINKAIVYFTKLKNTQTNSEYKNMAILSLVEIYMKRGESSEAEAILNGLRDQELYNKSLKVIADYYLTNNENEKANQYYSKISDLSSIDVIYGRAVSQYRVGKYTEALANFRKLNSTKYRNESLYYQMAIEFANKKYDWILKNKESVIGLNLSPEQSVAINSLIAASAFEIGEYKIAEEYYSKSYYANPTKESLYRLIVTVSKSENTAKLKKLIDEYQSKFPGDKEYKKNISIVEATQLYKTGNGDQAIEIYKGYLATEKDPEIVSKLIETMIAQKKYSDVMEYLNTQENNSENIYLKGIAAMGMGEYEKAAQYFNTVLQGSTQDKSLIEKSRYNLIKDNFLWENYKQTIALGEEYINSNNIYGVNDVLDKIAISYFRIDNFGKAREYFIKMKDISNMKDYAQFQIAETYYTEKNYNQAKIEYEKSAMESINPEYKEKGAYWELSTLYLIKNVKEFENKSKEFTKQFPTSKYRDNISLMQGELYTAKGDTSKGLENYEELYNQTKDDYVKEKSLTKILDLSQNSKNYEKERSWIDKLSNKDKKSYYLVKLYKKQKKYDKAKDELNKLLQSEDYKDFAAVELGDYYFNKKDYKNAKANYEIVVNMENSTYKDRALYQKANIQKELGKNSEAVVTYTKVYLLYPNSEYALESKIRSAESYEGIGKNQDAITQYKELLETESNNKEYFLEKLIILNLKMKNQKMAKQYYEQLKKENKNLAQKYKDFFNGGEKK